MPREATLGHILLEDAVPEDLKHLVGTLDKKGIARLYQALADAHPDKYRDVAKKLADISTRAGYESGGYSFGIEDLQPHPETAALRRAYENHVAQILSDKTLSDKMRDASLVKASLEHSDGIKDSVMKTGLATKNPLAMQVSSGAKGKPENLKSLIAGDGLYQDQNFNPVPYPITRSFAEGLTPAQYFAGTFGARFAIVQTKLATASGGYLAKRLNNSAHRLVVTSHDGADRHATTRGFPVALDEPDNEGALIAHPVGGYRRDTILTRDVIADLKRQGVKDILVRSPLVGGPDDGGVHGKDVGIRERGRIAPVGEYVGLAASQSLGEPLTQMLISCLTFDTKVRMSDGCARAVGYICPGDCVLGADLSGKTFPLTVTRTYYNGVQPCVRTVFNENGEAVLESTREHKILATPDIQLSKPSKLPVGTEVEALFALKADGTVARRTTQDDIGYQPVYDIEVDHPDGLFVLANGLIVSNSKHGGGVAGAAKGQKGFPVLDQLTSIPSTFPGGAVHAQHDGIVTAIREAPQGGRYIAVDGKEHYAGPDLEVKIKPGDKVEAGDAMTDGLENPAEYVKHKGIGEGRRRFVDVFRRTAADSGFFPHRRNLELITRGLINHVHVDKEFGDHTAGDIIPYTQMEHGYDPRPGSRDAPPKDLLNHYLERPVLHHSIGTRIVPSMLPEFEKYNIGSVTAHAEPPPFSPVMIRSQENVNTDEDWGARMLGSGNEKHLLKGTHRGDSMDTMGTSYVPALMAGVDFGTKGKTVGWKPETPQPPQRPV